MPEDTNNEEKSRVVNMTLNKLTFAAADAAIGFFPLAVAQIPPRQVRTEAPSAVSSRASVLSSGLCSTTVTYDY
jgi:hypothetical protein